MTALEMPRAEVRNRAWVLLGALRAAKNRRGGVLRGGAGSRHSSGIKTRQAGFAQGLQWVRGNGLDGGLMRNGRFEGVDGTNGTDETDLAEAFAADFAVAEARSANGVDLAAAAAAFEADLRPVRDALVEALQAGDIAALRGLRAMLPGLLGDVNDQPALADVLAEMVGREVAESLTRRREDAKEEDAALVNGNGKWRKELHPTGRNGRFVESKMKRNIQRGRNAMRRVYSEEVDVPAAMHREDVGDIDFLWDHNGMGIRHIIARREKQDADRPDLNKLGVYELLDRLPEVIAKGIVKNPDRTSHTIEIEHEGIRVLLAERRGKSKNVWLMSGFEIDPESQRKGRNR